LKVRVWNWPGEVVAELDARRAILPRVLVSQRAKVVKDPDAAGLVKALPEAVHDLFPAGLDAVVQERSPVLGGAKLGETANPPPEAWVLPTQAAVAVAVPPETRLAEALRVEAGAFALFFLASARVEVRPPKAARAARERTIAMLGLAMLGRERDRSFSLTRICGGILYPARGTEGGSGRGYKGRN